MFEKTHLYQTPSFKIILQLCKISRFSNTQFVKFMYNFVHLVFLQTFRFPLNEKVLKCLNS